MNEQNYTNHIIDDNHLFYFYIKEIQGRIGRFSKKINKDLETVTDQQVHKSTTDDIKKRNHMMHFTTLLLCLIRSIRIKKYQ